MSLAPMTVAALMSALATPESKVFALTQSFQGSMMVLVIRVLTRVAMVHDMVKRAGILKARGTYGTLANCVNS
jgi:hypothetical protein